MNLFRVIRAALAGCLMLPASMLAAVPAMAGAPASAYTVMDFVTDQTDPALIDHAIARGFKQDNQLIAAANAVARESILSGFPYESQRRKWAGKIRPIDDILRARLDVHCGSFTAKGQTVVIYGKAGCKSGEWIMLQQAGLENSAGRRVFMVETGGRLTEQPVGMLQLAPPRPLVRRHRMKPRRKPVGQGVPARSMVTVQLGESAPAPVTDRSAWQTPVKEVRANPWMWGNSGTPLARSGPPTLAAAGVAPALGDQAAALPR